MYGTKNIAEIYKIYAKKVWKYKLDITSIMQIKSNSTVYQMSEKHEIVILKVNKKYFLVLIQRNNIRCN